MPSKGPKKAPAARNTELAKGIMRFSRARMFHKRGAWALKKKNVAAKPKPKAEEFVVKKIGGDKNGGERKVLKLKSEKRVPEIRGVKQRPRRSTKLGQAKLRSSLTPGTICILLAGRHKGKRVVLLKQLDKSGCLLVTGPLKLNNCPLRRVPASYVIATQTKLDISSVKVPEHINDDYFKRARKAKASKKDDADLFTTTKTEYVVSDQRKTDQKSVDKQLIEVLRKSKDKKALFGYLGSYFWLAKGQAPHSMIF